MEVILFTGLILGLASNVHCLGMCGPIAMILPLNRTNNWTILSGTLQYNLARSLTYGLLGLLIGMVGMTIQLFGILQWLSIFAGVALVVFAWRKQLNGWFPRLSNPFGIQKGIQSLMGKAVRSKSWWRLMAFGAINGLLPCGMVYVALLNALLAEHASTSAFAMVAFGVGTLPMMIFVPFMSNKLGAATRQRLNRSIPYILTVVGLLIAVRGMNLGIPFVSPRVDIVKNGAMSMKSDEKSTEKPTVEMSCCHKKEACDE